MDYDIMNTEIAESNIHMFVSSEQESESDNITEVN